MHFLLQDGAVLVFCVARTRTLLVIRCLSSQQVRFWYNECCFNVQYAKLEELDNSPISHFPPLSSSVICVCVLVVPLCSRGRSGSDLGSGVASLFATRGGFQFAVPGSKVLVKCDAPLRERKILAMPSRQTELPKAPSFSDERRRRENRVPSPAD